MRRWGLWGVIVLGLVACTPALDWRTVVNDEGAFSVLLPAKPTLDEHRVQVAGHVMTMRMQAAVAAGAVFAVGVVMLPNDDPKLQSAVLEMLQDGLARNLGAKAILTKAHLALGGGINGRPLGQIEVSQMDLAGTVPNEHTQRIVHARFVARGARAYQVVVIADHEVSADALARFFDSVQLY